MNMSWNDTFDNLVNEVHRWLKEIFLEYYGRISWIEDAISSIWKNDKDIDTTSIEDIHTFVWDIIFRWMKWTDLPDWLSYPDDKLLAKFIKKCWDILEGKKILSSSVPKDIQQSYNARRESLGEENMKLV